MLDCCFCNSFSAVWNQALLLVGCLFGWESFLRRGSFLDAGIINVRIVRAFYILFLKSNGIFNDGFSWMCVVLFRISTLLFGIFVFYFVKVYFLLRFEDSLAGKLRLIRYSYNSKNVAKSTVIWDKEIKII